MAERSCWISGRKIKVHWKQQHVYDLAVQGSPTGDPCDRPLQDTTVIRITVRQKVLLYFISNAIYTVGMLFTAAYPLTMKTNTNLVVGDSTSALFRRSVPRKAYPTTPSRSRYSLRDPTGRLPGDHGTRALSTRRPRIPFLWLVYFTQFSLV